MNMCESPLMSQALHQAQVHMLFSIITTTLEAKRYYMHGSKEKWKKLNKVKYIRQGLAAWKS